MLPPSFGRTLFRLRLDSFENPTENIFAVFRKKFSGKFVEKEATGCSWLYVLVTTPNIEEIRCQPVLHNIHRESLDFNINRMIFRGGIVL